MHGQQDPTAEGAAPSAWGPNDLVVALQEEFGMVPGAPVVGVKEARARSQAHESANLVLVHIRDNGMPLFLQE